MAGKVYVGVDVSKNKLDVCAEGGRPFVIRNCPSAIRQVLQRLAREHGDVRVCFESTGVCGKALLECCHGQGVKVSELNAKRVRKWADGIGMNAKTDRIDAQVLCRYGRDVDPRTVAPAKPWVRTLQEMRDLRGVWVDGKVRLAGHLEQASSKAAARELRKEISRMEKKIKGLDAQMETIFEENAPSLLSRMTSVKGVGVVTACLVVAAMPEIGTLGGKRAAMLAGVAPRTRQSGETQMPGHIGGGRLMARGALYMSAVSAVRHNHVLGAFYRRKRAEGKPGRVALTAVMRKLMGLLERIAADPLFVPASPPPSSLPPSPPAPPLLPVLTTPLNGKS
jgi:transposase